MAHSFIYAKHQTEFERNVKVHDSILQIFCHLFLKTVESKQIIGGGQTKISVHYKEQLNEYIGFIDLMLNEIAETADLKAWFMAVLYELQITLNEFGDYIDNVYLNNVPQLIKGYSPDRHVFTEPYPVVILNSLLNDILWVLNEKPNPSGVFKWSVEKAIT